MQGHTSQPATVERLGAAMRALRARLSFRRLRPPLRAASLIFTTGLLAFGIAILVSGLSTGLALQYGPNLRPLVLRVLLGLLVWDIGKVVGVALGAVLLARLAVLPARPSGIALTVCVYALDVGLAALLGHPRLIVSRRVAFPLGRSPLSRWKYRRARLFLAVSRHVQAALLAGGVPADRIAVVYDGVPLLPLSSRTGGILAPAPADPLKGERLLEAAARLGGFPVLRSANLAADLREASLMLYLTEQEGLGSAVLLAFSAAVPVVASRCGGLTEIVEHGETGLLVDNTPEAVAEAVRRLRADPELAARLAAAGRRLVEERFSVRALVQNTLRAYQEVL